MTEGANRRYYARVTSTPDRAPDPRPQRTRAAIYSAARELGEAQTDVTVNALARRAGVSRAAFYSHFSSLDDVVCGIISDMLPQVAERHHDFVSDETDPHVRVRREIRRLADYVAAHRGFISGMLAWKISNRARGSLVDVFAALFEFAYDVLGERVPDHLPRHEVARFHAGGVMEILMQWLQNSEFENPQGQSGAADVLAESILKVLPPWYTGIEPGAPIPPREQDTERV